MSEEDKKPEEEQENKREMQKFKRAQSYSTYYL
jgi:hypothetical protein